MDSQDILDITRGVMGRTFQIDPAAITAATRADDLLRWDSLNHLTLVIGLEKRFNTRLPKEPMRMAHDVGSLVQVIADALATQT